MHKKISLFHIKPSKPDPEWLGVRLVERRLARQRRLMERSQPVADWLNVATAIWQLEQVGDDDRGFVEIPTVNEYPNYPKRLSSAERSRIMEWVQNRVSGMAEPSPLPAKLTKEERDALVDAAQNMRAVYLTEHQVDVAFAAVHEDFPWLGSLTEKAWHLALRRTRSGLPASVGAMLLSGPPGLGKSSWARTVAQAMTLPSLEIDVGVTGGMFDLQGTARGWGSAEKGRLVSALLSERIGNPIVILDEIDAGSRSVGTMRGSLPGIFKVLMGMLEPSTAKSWTCPYHQVPLDLRHVSWICTSNDISHIEQALLDRMVIVDIPHPTYRQLRDFIAREAARRFNGDDAGAIVDQIEKLLKLGCQPSLRHAVRWLDRIEAAVDRPLLH